MSNRVKGKVALVTAAGQGIGRAIAEALIAEGATVIATDVAEDKVKDLAAAKRVKLDVRSQDNVDALEKTVAGEFGALDILVNCAGYVANGSVLDCSDKDWDFSFDLNVKSMHRTIKAFLPAMLQKKSGAIVNISSAVSSIRGVPNRYAYGATKAAVIGLTKAVAADFIKRWHPLQRGLPRHDRIALARRAHRGLGEGDREILRGDPAGLCRSPADGPPRHRAGSRGARPLPCQRRGKLHYRPGASRRRRDGAVAGHSGAREHSIAVVAGLVPAR